MGRGERKVLKSEEKMKVQYQYRLQHFFTIFGIMYVQKEQKKKKK